MLEVNQGDNKKDVSNNIEGRLKIKKIDLSLPILKGASKENLKKSVASLEGTGSIGKVGNYCIAGHRSQAYGRNFNRLDELEVGDELVIETLEKEYNYVIEKILC